jgi:uncharacterized protein involved in exopolysaccharide biosynthesis
MITLLDQFNAQRRRTRATSERRFIEGRLVEVKRDLRNAEDRLARFLAQNRVIGAPDLAFQRDRLQREVELQQSLYLSVAQAHEKAKIDEVRDTPVLTVLNAPEIPVQPDGRGTVKRTFLALLAGSAFGVLLAFWKASRESGALKGSDELEEFSLLTRELAGDLTSPIRTVRRLVRV